MLTLRNNHVETIIISTSKSHKRNVAGALLWWERLLAESYSTHKPTQPIYSWSTEFDIFNIQIIPLILIYRNCYTEFLWTGVHWWVICSRRFHRWTPRLLIHEMHLQEFAIASPRTKLAVSNQQTIAGPGNSFSSKNSGMIDMQAWLYQVSLEREAHVQMAKNDWIQQEIRHEEPRQCSASDSLIGTLESNWAIVSCLGCACWIYRYSG